MTVAATQYERHDRTDGGATNGHVERVAGGSSEPVLEERPSPSGRRRIRFVNQRGPAPVL